MRIAYLDCFSGISGDMFLGAAVDAGVPLQKLQEVCRALGLNTSLTAQRSDRGGVSAIKIDVLVDGQADRPLDLRSKPAHSHAHSHPEHPHPHSHEHGDQHARNAAHESSAAPAASHTPHAHRGLKEIRPIIAQAPISTGARKFALHAFELLAAAEAKIHNCDPESIHFHEVGSEDAIVDIVCAAVAIEMIAAERWYCSALNLGSGTVQCAHGVLPVPAPATAELLKGAPVYSSGVRKELLTPTGAAILRALDVRFEPLPRMLLSATGYGAGARELPGQANVVRLLIGKAFEQADAEHPQDVGSPWSEDNTDTVVVLEANLDDMNPQLFSYVQEKLLAAGALDVFGIPVQMKKGRPALLFTVLALPSQAEMLARMLLVETTTLGLRMRREQRRVLDREHCTVESQWGPIRIKLGRLRPNTSPQQANSGLAGGPTPTVAGEVVNSAPEFEDCRRIAEDHGVPLKTVLQEAVRLYRNAAEAEDSAAKRRGLSSQHE